MACECVNCDECDGFGQVWISWSGKYIGKYKQSDCEDLDSCPDCDGDGRTFICHECETEEEYDEQWG